MLETLCVEVEERSEENEDPKLDANVQLLCSSGGCDDSRGDELERACKESEENVELEEEGGRKLEWNEVLELTTDELAESRTCILEEEGVVLSEALCVELGVLEFSERLEPEERQNYEHHDSGLFHL